MKAYQTFQVEIKDYIAYLKLSAPPVNCLTPQVLQDLQDIVEQLEGEETLRAVVLGSGNPKIFCAGADIQQFSAWDARKGEQMSAWGSGIYRRLAALPVPVVCAVHGGAYGGGLELTLACDIRVFERTAKVGLPETGLGVLPGYGGTQRLSNLIGKGRAGLMLYTGSIIDGQQAMAYGVCDVLTEPGESWDEACRLAKVIASKAPTAIRGVKECLNASEDSPCEAGFLLEDAWFGRLCATEDKIEGVRAFLAKEAPHFSGK